MSLPNKQFYGQLKRLSTLASSSESCRRRQSCWPRAIEVAIETIKTAPFLSEEQKRDIFYNNAARFLRLSKEEIARHHGR